jgi:hypothetical protein
MDKAEMRQLAEINRMKEACRKTTSEYLRRDYEKSINRMERELKEYRAWKRKAG